MAEKLIYGRVSEYQLNGSISINVYTESNNVSENNVNSNQLNDLKLTLNNINNLNNICEIIYNKPIVPAYEKFLNLTNEDMSLIELYVDDLYSSLSDKTKNVYNNISDVSPTEAENFAKDTIRRM